MTKQQKAIERLEAKKQKAKENKEAGKEKEDSA
jgi:hypothetical protein